MTKSEGGGISTPAGWLTVEQAGAMLDMEPWRVRDLAVLGGVPLGYGPFPKVAGSAFRVFIDKADMEKWEAAGRPLNADYRSPPKLSPPVARKVGGIAGLVAALARKTRPSRPPRGPRQ